MKTIPAVANEDLVRLGTIVWLAAPNREEAQQQTLIGDGVEVVELARRLEIVALRIEPVGADPQMRLARLPPRTRHEIGILPVAADAAELRRIAPDAVDPHAAKRVVEHRRAVAAR